VSPSHLKREFTHFVKLDVGAEFRAGHASASHVPRAPARHAHVRSGRLTPAPRLLHVRAVVEPAAV